MRNRNKEVRRLSRSEAAVKRYYKETRKMKVEQLSQPTFYIPEEKIVVFVKRVGQRFSKQQHQSIEGWKAQGFKVEVPLVTEEYDVILFENDLDRLRVPSKRAFNEPNLDAIQTQPNRIRQQLEMMKIDQGRVFDPDKHLKELQQVDEHEDERLPEMKRGESLMDIIDDLGKIAEKGNLKLMSTDDMPTEERKPPKEEWDDVMKRINTGETLDEMIEKM